jgi:flagellum-specific peptidoglycan hydrolase FlgJ
MATKPCSCCKQELPTTEFGPCKNTKSGLSSWCRPCTRERARQRYLKNPKKQHEATKRWAARNPEKVAQHWRTSRQRRKAAISEYRKLPHVREAARRQHRAYVQKHPEKIRQYQRNWYAKNSHVYILLANLRRKIVRSQQAWLTPENKSQIADIYRKCREITKQTGIDHEVDHVMPLNGVDSCGLHVPWNLRIVTRAMNRSKGNRIEAA